MDEKHTPCPGASWEGVDSLTDFFAFTNVDPTSNCHPKAQMGFVSHGQELNEAAN